MTAGLGYWVSNKFFDQTTASRKFRRPFARSMTASVQHRRIQTLPKTTTPIPARCRRVAVSSPEPGLTGRQPPDERVHFSAMPRTKRISSRARPLLKVDGIVESPSSSTILQNKHSSALKVYV